MNIIVIITDSLRVDHVGCYGSHVKTPNLDRLAAEGTKFLHAYSENLPTMPTRRGWWTGKYHFHEAGWQPFTEEDYLMAEILWDQGFTSAFITDVYHMHKPVYNCGRGFDTTVFVRGQEYDPWIVDPDVKVNPDESTIHRYRGGEGRESNETWRKRIEQYLKNCSVRKTEEDYYVARVARESIRWLEYVTKKQKDKLFLWVDMFDPHEPWDPPAPYNRMYTDPDYNGPDLVDPVPGDVEGYMTPDEVRHTKNLYAGEVTFVDKWVGVLLDRIRDLGLYDNSLIVHSTDHGEPFGEHGYIRKARPRNYEELIHIPWIIRHPEGIGAGKEVDAIVQTVDMLPTVLEAVGIKSDKLTMKFTEPDQSSKSENIFPQDLVTRQKRQVLGGCNLLPLMAGEIESIRDLAFGGHHNREWYARSKEWTYLLPIDGSRPPELYDRKTDPQELNNVINKYPRIATGLELELRRFVDTLQQK
ncbi:sulfatase-like hydrolase/transferase [Candidatus Poribacteria bacterium]|nr:sulfatase-like hydrolase/transferase [Candidatus Poribacteria bacterium]